MSAFRQAQVNFPIAGRNRIARSFLRLIAEPFDAGLRIVEILGSNNEHRTSIIGVNVT